MNNLDVLQLVKVKVNLEPSDLGPDYETKIQNKIMNTYGNRCYINGFVDKFTIKIVKIENGRREGSHLHGFLTFNVEFSAIFRIPKKNVEIPCYIKKINKFGILAHAYPMDIIIPRQLHALKKEDLDKFEHLTEGELIRVKILDHTIENGRLVVVSLITDVGLNRPNIIDLPPDGLIRDEPFTYGKKLIVTDKLPESREELGSGHELDELKERVNVLQDQWPIIRKEINLHQLIAESSADKTIIKYNPTKIYDPLSRYPIMNRDYFKLWEILTDTEILKDFKDKAINICHLAEGPGACIQSLIDFRNHQHTSIWTTDTYYAITLKKQNTAELESVEDWENAAGTQYFKLLEDSGYYIIRSYGAKGDGNLLNPDNISSINNEIKGKCHVIIGNGAYYINDETTELYNVKIYFAEILTALYNQEVGGCFIFKVYDIYYDITVQLLHLLTIYYSRLIITKPRTSEPTSSEKYIVCSGFQGINIRQMDALFVLFKQLIETVDKKYIIRLFEFYEKPDSSFIETLKQFNKYNNDLQIEKFNEGLDLSINGGYKKKTIQDEYTQNQQLVAKSWCETYRLPYVID